MVLVFGLAIGSEKNWSVGVLFASRRSRLLLLVLIGDCLLGWTEEIVWLKTGVRQVTKCECL
jgi:hypothetical protein